MRVAYVCTDPGIPVFGSKGASLHVRAVVRELRRRGHEVHLVCARLGGETPADLADLPVHRLPVVRAEATAERERSAQASDAAVAAVLTDLSPDLVYERYALWGRTATAWAQQHHVPSVLEVNAPLVEEQARHRGLVDRAAGSPATWPTPRPSRCWTRCAGWGPDRCAPSSSPSCAPTRPG